MCLKLKYIQFSNKGGKEKKETIMCEKQGHKTMFGILAEKLFSLKLLS